MIRDNLKTVNKAIQELLTTPITTRDELTMVKRKLSKKYGISVLKNSDIIWEYKEMINDGVLQVSPTLERVLRKRAVRTLSGIAPIAVLTKPYPCPGECAYCPTEPGVPQSYLSNEPAVMRAIRCGYHPYIQVQDRLRALIANGHEPTKIELIVIGGTWSVLPDKYKYWYLANCFAGANEFTSPLTPLLIRRGEGAERRGEVLRQNQTLLRLKTHLFRQQKRNEKAKYKIVGITLETRPDYIKEKELRQMRELGCTRVEIGVQAIDDKVLKINKRGHEVETTVKATKLLKNFGFKVTYHIMPGLPGSTPIRDLKMFKQLFSDERFQPDQIKFYPTVVTKGSLLYKWWKRGKYKPYSDRVLQKLIADCKKVIPPYVRVIRLIRDIPGESIMAGNMVTNLRQVMKKEGVRCKCIRCREVRNQKFEIRNLKLVIRKYQASRGEEYFISYESKDGKTLYGFCRLRLPKDKGLNPEYSGLSPLKGVALIRELHVYGELVPIGKEKRVQHAGLGKKLLAKAEQIAHENGFKKIAIISGIGVRDYYRKVGYRLRETYMVKRI